MTASSSTRVRPARLSDADGIADVHIRSWRETYSGIIPDRFMDDAARESRRLMWESILSLAPLPGSVVIAERDERMIGFAFAGPAEHPDAIKSVPPARNLHLYSIYLLAEEQGAGIGAALLEAVLKHQPAQLWVLRGNERAREFYERNGFRHDGSEFTDPDLDGLVEIRMVR